MDLYYIIRLQTQFWHTQYRKVNTLLNFFPKKKLNYHGFRYSSQVPGNEHDGDSPAIYHWMSYMSAYPKKPKIIYRSILESSNSI